MMSERPHDRADGESAAEELAVGGEIRGDAVELLGATESGTESGQHLVEHQHDAVAGGQFAQPADERDGLERGMSALHRFDDDDRDP